MFDPELSSHTNCVIFVEAFDAVLSAKTVMIVKISLQTLGFYIYINIAVICSRYLWFAAFIPKLAFGDWTLLWIFEEIIGAILSNSLLNCLSVIRGSLTIIIYECICGLCLDLIVAFSLCFDTLYRSHFFAGKIWTLQAEWLCVFNVILNFEWPILHRISFNHF